MMDTAEPEIGAPERFVFKGLLLFASCGIIFPSTFFLSSEMSVSVLPSYIPETPLFS